jgi:peroxiredoxin
MTTALKPKPCEHCGRAVQFDLLAKLLADDRRSTPANAWLQGLDDPRSPLRIATQSHPLLGQSAPDFALNDVNNRLWRLKDRLSNGPVVLVFYLGYYCNACAHDLFELNADLERFHTVGAEVIAVSGDSPDITRQRFEEYGAFNFPVLSDPGHAVARAYGTYEPATTAKPERVLHGTFLIGRDGRVRWANRGDTPFRGNMALLIEIAQLNDQRDTPGQGR